MPLQTIRAVFRTKIAARSQMSYGDQAKSLRTFIDWNFKFIAWCALTAAVVKIARAAGSTETMILSLYMTMLLSLFVSLQPFVWVCEIVDRGRTSGTWSRRVVWFLVMYVVSMSLMVMVQFFMVKVLDIVMTISR